MDSPRERSRTKGSRRPELPADSAQDEGRAADGRTTGDRFSRPLTRDGIREATGIAALLWLGGLLFLASSVLINDLRNQRPALLGLAVVGAFACLVLASFRLMTDDVLFRWAGAVLGASSVVAVSVVSGLVLSVGDVVPEVVVFYAQVPALSFYCFRWRWALLITAAEGVAYALVLVATPASLPHVRWLAVVMPCLAVGALIGPLAVRAEIATTSAHRARAELAELNASLAERVEHQVAELERTGELRRFLAPEVAEAVMTAGHLLAPHRREIAIFFSDLRGFTAFASRAEPEDVLELLNEYYACVGTVLRSHGATIGDYVGDGVMAFLGDPLPASDLPGTCLRMAGEARDALARLEARWRRRGQDVGFGIGVALGHATLGVVGFEGRSGYAPLGTVVNLAARLCDAATNGTVLVDRRAAADGGLDITSPRVLTLKGLGEVPVYTLP